MHCATKNILPQPPRAFCSVDECPHYALNLPTSIVVTGIENSEILDQAFAAAKSFHLLSDDGRGPLLQKTRRARTKGRFELFKTLLVFDSTADNGRPRQRAAGNPRVDACVDSSGFYGRSALFLIQCAKDCRDKPFLFEIFTSKFFGSGIRHID